MPLTVALHCSMVKKPQFVAPPPLPEYWAHHRVLSQGRAVAGVCDCSTVTSTGAAKTLVTERIETSWSLLEITPRTQNHSSVYRRRALNTRDCELMVGFRVPLSSKTTANLSVLAGEA